MGQLIWKVGYGAYFAQGRRAYMVCKIIDHWQAQHADLHTCPHENSRWIPIMGSLAAHARTSKGAAEAFEETVSA